MEKPIWTKAGLSMSEYRDLPWKEKKKLIIRHRGIYIEAACFDCGKTMSAAREEATQRSLKAAGLDKHPYGRLIWAYRQHNAEDHTIKNNYPNAALSCGGPHDR